MYCQSKDDRIGQDWAEKGMMGHKKAEWDTREQDGAVWGRRRQATREQCAAKWFIFSCDHEIYPNRLTGT